MLGALAFVLGWLAWSFGSVAAVAWVIVSSGDPGNPWLAIPMILVATILVWGGFFVGLRMLVGEWLWTRR